HDRVRIDALPVLDRHATGLEEIAVRAECLPGIRDRFVARLSRGIRAGQHGDPSEKVRVGSLHHEDLRVGHNAIHTFWPQSGRSDRTTPSIETSSSVGPPSTSSITTPGRTPRESRYSRNPGSCSN